VPESGIWKERKSFGFVDLIINVAIKSPDQLLRSGLLETSSIGPKLCLNCARRAYFFLRKPNISQLFQELKSQ
jgi:hypothetical protein